MDQTAVICDVKTLATAFFVCVATLGHVGEAAAQQAQDRAGALKSWREQCNDPDPDLRQAYVQEAIASGDVAVQRICVRLALESDNADIRNLGLRAAIASTQRIFFTVAMPKEIEDAIKAAGSNEKKQTEISRWNVTKDYQAMKNGLSFEIDGVDVTSNASNWYPLANFTARNDNFKGVATITGSTITWQGAANLTHRDCSMTLEVATGAELIGTLQCSDLPKFPVSAKLL